MGSLFMMMFIIVMISVVMGFIRTDRPRLDGRSYGQHPHLDPRVLPPGQIAPWAPPGYGPAIPYGQPMGYGHPGYDPASAQPMAPAARDALNSDITTFGDELRDLDLDVVGRELDERAQADYSAALDAYDGAKQQLSQARSNADVRRIAEILENGRYAIACVKARVHGQPIPEHRPPCFFDPSHGVSVSNVHWAPPGGAVREVPACAADAQRVRMGNDPSIRMVMQGPQRMAVPYWEDRQYAPFVQGYYGRYGADPALRQITSGALMIGGFSLLMGLLDD